MHVAILTGHFPPGAFGGAELQAEGWAKRLARRQHRVTVITRRDDVVPPGTEERDGYRVVRLPVARVPMVRAFVDLAAIERALVSLEPRPDVILCFMTFLSGLAGVRAGRRLGVPAIVWVRGEAEYLFSGPRAHPASSRLHRRVSPGVWRDAAWVLVQSEANRVDLLAALERHAPSVAAIVRPKLGVVGNGLELPVGPFPPGTRVLSVGRLITDKGFDTVIDACARVPCPLTIAGEGPERSALEALASRVGADVRFAGFADRDALARLYRDASAVVLAARHGEGLPNVLLEAMAYARPVVATSCAGTRDLLTDGIDGLQVPPDDPAALAQALAALAREPARAARMGEAARERIASFGWDQVYPQLESVLERVVAR